MTDPALADLFAEGSAPARDPAFAARVAAEMASARLRQRARLIFSIRLAVTMALAAAIFAVARVLGPALAPLAEQAPRVMGVPAPLLFGVILVALLIRAPRLLRPRFV